MQIDQMEMIFGCKTVRGFPYASWLQLPGRERRLQAVLEAARDHGHRALCRCAAHADPF